MSFDDIDLQWFAAEDEGRTEEPSEYKLQKAREEGRVAKSTELSGAIVLLFTVLTLILLGSYIFRTSAEIMRFFFLRVTQSDVQNPAFMELFFRKFSLMILPVTFVGILAGVSANIIQNRGMIFSLKPIEPQFSKVAPKFGQYFKKTLFSFQGAFNIVKSIGKVAVLAVIAFLTVRRTMPVILLSIQNGNAAGAVTVISKAAAFMLVASAVVLRAIAVPDYFVNRHEFMESMKMTKFEVKQEYKEMEGDPQVKSRLMAEARRLLQRNMPKAVKEADVVITNPTHFAVSMKYDRAVDDSPKVTAKGQDETALLMRRIAKENNVPIVENRPLARSLYAETEVGDIIPDKYLAVLANIYAEIMKINSKKK